MENVIRDPRDGRKRLVMIEEQNMLGKDTSAWQNKDGQISVYRSTDAPKSECWIHGLTVDNYRDYMEY